MKFELKLGSQRKEGGIGGAAGVFKKGVIADMDFSRL